MVQGNTSQYFINKSLVQTKNHNINRINMYGTVSKANRVS